jgi:hypothetical protein
MSSRANDQFEVYFTEKLWEMIPPVYRYEDGKDENPNKGVLRSFVGLLASQATVLRRSNDHLWDDQFIELCQDWAVPYLADLLGTRLVSSLNKRARRTDVAKTIYYRRRKGTLRILEELIRDITGWDGKVFENFRRLARTRHGLDPEPEGLGGLLTRTLPGGWADLRSAHGSELTNGPFDEFHHTADMRKHIGNDGRYGITKLAFHLYPLTINIVTNSTPFAISEIDGFYGFDPSGRSIPLFMPDFRPKDFDWSKSWCSALEWELASPIPCRLLAHSEYVINETIIQELVSDFGLSVPAAEDLHKISGLRFRDETRLNMVLQSLPSSAELMTQNIYLYLLDKGLAEDCGKSVLLAKAVHVTENGTTVSPELISAGDLKNVPSLPLPASISLIIDPKRGKFLFRNPPSADKVKVTYHYGFPGKIGAGTYDRTGFIESETVNTIFGGAEITAIKFHHNKINQINDSLTYGPVPDKAGIKKLTLRASDEQRPFICLNRDWVLTGLGEDSELCLDGLWIGSSVLCQLVIKGTFKCVVIRHCTIDPGNDPLVVKNLKGDPLNPVPLLIEGKIDYLLIDSCITGPILAGGNGHIENIIIRDSIVQSIDGNPALNIIEGLVNTTRITVLGDIMVHRLQASETLINGTAKVTDTQHGCFRFSAANANSILPSKYESHQFPPNQPNLFTSRNFGEPGYAQLSEAAPAELNEGGENGCEIGAFNSLINAVKKESLLKKVEEYMPFGLIPIFIKET